MFFFLSRASAYIMRAGARGKKRRVKIHAVFCGLFVELFTFDFIFARNSFAGLIAYRAARFASRLAGASAFAASGYLLVCGFRDRLNHSVLLSFFGFSMTLL